MSKNFFLIRCPLHRSPFTFTFTAEYIHELGTQYDLSSTQFVNSTQAKVKVFLGIRRSLYFEVKKEAL